MAATWAALSPWPTAQAGSSTNTWRHDGDRWRPRPVRERRLEAEVVRPSRQSDPPCPVCSAAAGQPNPVVGVRTGRDHAPVAVTTTRSLTLLARRSGTARGRPNTPTTKIAFIITQGPRVWSASASPVVRIPTLNSRDSSAASSGTTRTAPARGGPGRARGRRPVRAGTPARGARTRAGAPGDPPACRPRRRPPRQRGRPRR